VDAKDGGGRKGGGGGGASAAGAYYEVDEILDRSIKDCLGSGGTGQAVEYLVRWKEPPPPGTSYDVGEYKDSSTTRTTTNDHTLTLTMSGRPCVIPPVGLPY
jgi:hypothetical protein